MYTHEIPILTRICIYTYVHTLFIYTYIIIYIDIQWQMFKNGKAKVANLQRKQQQERNTHTLRHSRRNLMHIRKMIAAQYKHIVLGSLSLSH